MPLLSQRLLPYERHLIAQLGCTEAEYLAFKHQVYWLSRERPAEYALIPDIKNEPTAIVLFIVGLVLQGVGYLLSPKPNLPQQRQPQNRTLDSIVGRDRFAPTYGFQANQELSRYNEVIPIVFTEQKSVQFPGSSSQQQVGGVMIAPKLVWSRTYSWGGYQSIEMVFLAGQSPMHRPSNINENKAGVYLGQLPLDSFPDTDYRWYFNPGGTPVASTYDPSDSRLRGRDSKIGDFRADEADADNAFRAITLSGLIGEAFSHTFSPSTQIRFGVYNALANGTPHRPNFEIISYIGDQQGPLAALSAKLTQLCGNPVWAGTGRNYARQFGIVEVNGQKYPAATRNNGTEVNVTVDKNNPNNSTRIKVIYNAGEVSKTVAYDKNLFYPINDVPSDYTKVTPQPTYWQPISDTVDNLSIRNTIKTEHEQQDDLLKLGTRWLIGNCLWEVEKREPGNRVYDKTEKGVYSVTLKAISIFDHDGKGYVGVCDYDFVTTSTHLPEEKGLAKYSIDSAWYPLCKAEMAVVQNTRRCEVTEIGLKSNVWARLGGICNFNSLPTVHEKTEFDNAKVSVTTGTTQAYMRRASFFNIYVRPANNSLGFNDGWIKLNEYPFCVVGSTPQDQYNFIRIAQPFDQFEYRFRPVTSGELVHIIGINKEVRIGSRAVKGPCVRLNIDGITSGGDPNPYTDVVRTDYGTFTLRTRGYLDSIANLALNSEMVSSLKTTSSDRLIPTLTSVKFVEARVVTGNRTATAREISNGITRKINKDPDPNTEPFPVTTWPTATGSKAGIEYSFDANDQEDFKYVAGTKSIRMAMRLRVDDLGVTGAGATRRLYWTLINGTEIPSTFSGDWKAGERFTVDSKLFDSAQTVIRYTFEVNAATQIRIPGTVSGERIFDEYTGISEVSYYGNLITRSCDNNPEHEITYINECLANDAARDGRASYIGCAMAGLKIRSGLNLDRLEQLHIYQTEGIRVKRLRVGTNPPDGPSSIFTDLVYYLLTDKSTGIGELVSIDLIDENQLKRTGTFLEKNHLFFDDVLVEQQNIREFFARVSTTLLCNLVTRSGKFSIEPALPIHPTTYSIYDVKVPITAIFTEGNIIEGSFQLEYISAQERLPIRALVRYREEAKNRFPQEKTVVVFRNDAPNGPLEEFNFSHITSRYHAELFAKYALSSRHHRTHAVSFKTTPLGLRLSPGDYIRVVTQSSYVEPAASGIITDDGSIISPTVLNADQTYSVYIWESSQAEVRETDMRVDIKPGSTNILWSNKYKNAVFAVKETKTSSLVYMVDSLDLDEEGLVQVTASYFPVNSQGESVIADELKPSSTVFSVVAD